MQDHFLSSFTKKESKSKNKANDFSEKSFIRHLKKRSMKFHSSKKNFIEINRLNKNSKSLLPV